MKLMTKEIEEELKMNPLYSHDGEGKAAKVIVKYFNSCGSGTWLVTEGEKQKNGDWKFFGYCHIFEWEWGYFMLSDFENVNKKYGFPLIQRDLYSEGRVMDMIM